jgi:hypothetical protein
MSIKNAYKLGVLVTAKLSKERCILSYGRKVIMNFKNA